VTPIAYIKLGLAAVVLIALGWIAFIVNGWRLDSRRVEQVETELSDLKAAQESSQKASQGLQDELTKLRNSRKPSPVVRVCRDADKLPKAGAGRDGSTPGAGELPQAAGPDIGTDLYALADEADELAARLRACQALLK
jgi:hypothetical protein